MTFQKDETGIRQTSANVAATLTVAEVAAGIIKSHDAVEKRFAEFRDQVFGDLDAARLRDNEMFKAEEASTPEKKSYPKKTSGSKPSSGGGDIDDPGSVAFKGKGKFAGLTVAEVYALTADEAGTGYAYTDKDGNAKAGSAYIEWCATNEKNPFMQKVASKFLEQRRAGSDA
jgi:hypothetical protein